MKMTLGKNVAALAPVALFMGACATPTTSLSNPPPSGQELSACGANNVQNFVNQELTPATRLAIQDRSQAQSIRWIAPNMAVTMDLREDRLNVNYSETNIIQSISCG